MNPAAVKQLLMLGARRLPGVPALEQGAGVVGGVAAIDISVGGAGVIDILASAAALVSHVPRVTAVPATIALDDCSWMWPYCMQPM